MTEEAWLNWNRFPNVMLAELQNHAAGSDRKWLRFALACCQRLSELDATHLAFRYFDWLDRRADDLDAKLPDIAHDRKALPPLTWQWEQEIDEIACNLAHRLVIAADLEPTSIRTTTADISDALIDAVSDAELSQQAINFGEDCFNEVPALVSGELVRQCVLLRDIFGNPFRPVTFAPEWRSDTAMSLARGMYESRDFSAMPILADALQDAGCDNADVLNHCRGDGPHVRGCWVVDLVLGKE